MSIVIEKSKITAASVRVFVSKEIPLPDFEKWISFMTRENGIIYKPLFKAITDDLGQKVNIDIANYGKKASTPRILYSDGRPMVEFKLVMDAPFKVPELLQNESLNLWPNIGQAPKLVKGATLLSGGNSNSSTSFTLTSQNKDKIANVETIVGGGTVMEFRHERGSKDANLRYILTIRVMCRVLNVKEDEAACKEWADAVILNF